MDAKQNPESAPHDCIQCSAEGTMVIPCKEKKLSANCVENDPHIQARKEHHHFPQGTTQNVAQASIGIGLGSA